MKHSILSSTVQCKKCRDYYIEFDIDEDGLCPGCGCSEVEDEDRYDYANREQ